MTLRRDIIGKSGKTRPKPDKPCYVCGADDWWLRDNGQGNPEWLCGK